MLNNSVVECVRERVSQGCKSVGIIVVDLARIRKDVVTFKIIEVLSIE